MPRPTHLLIWLAGAALLGVSAALFWPGSTWLKSDFFSLLPATTDSEWQRRADALQSADYESTLVLRATGDAATSPEEFIAGAKADLAAAGYLNPERDDEQSRRWRALSGALYPFRQNLVTGADRAALEVDPDGVLERYRAYLFSPLGSAALSGLEGDPAGLFRRYLENALPAPETSGDDAELVAVSLAPASLALGNVEPLYALYRQWKQRAGAEQLSFQASGAPLYAAFGAHSARREISTIGMVSLAALAALLWWALRSGRALSLTLLCVGSGMAAGLLATVLLLREIHILTLVFGATLVGIAADYALHYLTHRIGAPSGERPLRDVLRALSLGALSSVTAFLALVLVPFPGIRQIGVFMASGLLASFVTVCLLFPALRAGPGPGARIPAFCRHLPPPGLRRWPVILLPVLLSLPGLSLLTPRDDVRDFYAAPRQLLEDQAEISEATGLSRHSHYFLVRAASEPALLRTEELLLDRARAGDVAGMEGVALSAISQLVPSPRRQQANAEALRQLADSGALARHLAALGFSPERAEAVAGQSSPAPGTLTLGALGDLDWPAGTGRFLGCRRGDRGECASYVRIDGEAGPEQLAALAASTEGVELVNPIARINALLANYRSRVILLLATGLGIAGLLLALLGGWRPALRILVLPAASCLASLGLLGALQGHYSIVNLLALLLVIGVSLDYAVFREYSAPAAQAATTLAITLSALTSILAFGMLGLSQTPVIADFGQTIAVGLAAAFALSWLLPLHREGDSRP